MDRVGHGDLQVTTEITHMQAKTRGHNNISQKH